MKSYRFRCLSQKSTMEIGRILLLDWNRLKTTEIVLNFVAVFAALVATDCL